MSGANNTFSVPFCFRGRGLTRESVGILRVWMSSIGTAAGARQLSRSSGGARRLGIF
jgi:hypothetical protein